MKLRKILSIEGVRGFAAIYVMLGHFVLLFQPYSFHPEYSSIIKNLFGQGHYAVILFFIVSGFSIHYSSTNSSFDTRKSLVEYFYKRIRRIYPIFFISLLLAIVVLILCENEHSSIKRVILSFFFLTDLSPGNISLPIPTNFPIWSLSYEIPYYLLYPLLHKGIKKYGINKIFVFSLIVSFLMCFFQFFDIPNHVANIMKLYWVWVAGVFIADLIITGKKIKTTYFTSGLIILLGLIFTIEKISLLREWLVAGLFFLIFISFFSQSLLLTSKEKIKNIVIGLIGVFCCYLLTYQDALIYHPVFVRYLLMVFILLLIIFVFVPFSSIQKIIRNFLRPFINFGSYSYAIYILHWPIMVFFKNKFEVQIHQNPIYMVLIILLVTIIVWGSSWLLEIKMQPIIARQMNKIFYKKKN